ncbi:MAG: hypothetical protein H6738_23365 [Alphaproteobacteria bacterium]|nr:hypothetical protein [Alphaproteobacteria bacterium]MCB9699745.1 hypothetical protein [Alphaproteobacteria bacterium]
MPVPVPSLFALLAACGHPTTAADAPVDAGVADTGEPAHTGLPDTSRIVRWVMPYAIIVWDAAGQQLHPYVLSSTTRDPRLLLVLGNDVWTFENDDVGNYCTVELSLTASSVEEGGGPNDLATLVYQASTSTDDCEGWDWSHLFDDGDPATLLDEAPLRIHMGGPLAPALEAVATDDQLPWFMGARYDGLPIFGSVDAYMYALELDADFQVVQADQGGVPVESDRFTSPEGGLATGYYIVRGPPLLVL